MGAIDDVRNKVQRILTQHGRVELDRDGDYVLRQGSAVTFVSVRKGFGEDGTIVSFRCPLVNKVKLTPEVYKWVATEGQHYKLGGCQVVPSREHQDSGSIWFSYAIVGDDLDESELMAGTRATILTSNDLDNQLRDMFGGELIGSDD
jgi:hypothetical protein